MFPVMINVSMLSDSKAF